jgi:hypothetical protein
MCVIGGSVRVLVTNLFVARGTGSEAVVELLADALKRAGHQPFLFAPQLGPQADRMRHRGHRVTNRLAEVGTPPDVIHAQHVTPALMAMAAFPGVPVVYACHSSIYEVETPRPHPQIRRVTALGERGRDRCLGRGFTADQIAIVPNAVDLARFQQRSPLPSKPQRALMIAKTEGHADAVREACARRGLALDEVGLAVGRFSDRLEEELPAYDIVFASGRSALEAAAVGCAVVLIDGAGLAGMLTTERLSAWRAGNFGLSVLSQPAKAHLVEQAIAEFDAADAARVTARLRQEASAEAYAAQYVALYEEAIADPPPADPAAIARATAAWLEDLLPSPAAGGWQDVAKEVAGYQAANFAPELHAVEARLAARIEALPSRRAMGLMRSAYRRVMPLPLRHKIRAWREG